MRFCEPERSKGRNQQKIWNSRGQSSPKRTNTGQSHSESRLALMIRRYSILVVVLAFTTAVQADETFVILHSVSGNRIQVSPGSAGQGMGPRGRGAGGMEAQPTQGIGRGRGRSGGGAAGGGRGRGRFGGQTQPKTTTVNVPSTAKITTAMRERRTFEFRVMGEIAGGLRNPIFTRMKEPMQARIVTRNNTITEINVITGDTDINQTSTSSSGESIIAVKPKRPPMKRK